MISSLIEARVSLTESRTEQDFHVPPKAMILEANYNLLQPNVYSKSESMCLNLSLVVTNHFDKKHFSKKFFINNRKDFFRPFWLSNASVPLFCI